MEYFLFGLILSQYVVSVLGTGCTTIIFVDEKLKDCRHFRYTFGKNISSYAPWKLNYYVLSKAIPFHKGSSSYIVPRQLNKGSCTTLRFKLMYGSTLQFNVFMSEYPSAQLYIKIFDIQDNARQVASWSSRKETEWKPMTWSTIVISILNDTVSSSEISGDFAVLILGIIRAKGTLLIDSIRLLTPESDGKCDYIDSTRQFRRAALGTVLNSEPLELSDPAQECVDGICDVFPIIDTSEKAHKFYFWLSLILAVISMMILILCIPSIMSSRFQIFQRQLPEEPCDCCCAKKRSNDES